MAHLLQRILRASHRYTCYTNLGFFGTSSSNAHLGKHYAKSYPKPSKWALDFKQELNEIMDEKSFTMKSISNLEDRFMIINRNATVQSFDVIVMAKLKDHKKPELAWKFMQYVKQKREPHMLVLINYMRSCVALYPKEIKKEYEELRKTLNFDTLNVSTLIYLLTIEVSTQNWRRIYEILKMLDKEIESGERPSIMNKAVGSVITAAIRSCNFEVIFDLSYNHPEYYIKGLAKHMLMPELYEALMEGKIPCDLFIQLYHDVCAESKMNLRQPQAEEIVHFQNRKDNGLKFSLTEIDKKSGKCNKCGHGMKKKHVTRSEILVLEQNVKDNLVVGKNIYKMTTPNDLFKYQVFLANTEYDVVVDGPNLYFGKETQFWTYFKDVVDQLKRHLKKKDLKILLLSDKWRFKGFYNVPNIFKHMLKLYPIDFSKTHDDVFLLMAALKNGGPCYMISNDNFRNHRSQLNPDQARIFMHWQANYQILHKEFKLEFPSAYHCISDMDDPAWHVPYEYEGPKKREREVAAYFKHSNLYLCVKKQNNYRKSPELQEYLRLKEKYEQNQKMRVSKS